MAPLLAALSLTSVARAVEEAETAAKAIPEPSPILLLAGALAMLLILSRKTGRR